MARARVPARFAMLCAGLALLCAVTLEGDFDRCDATASTAASDLEGSGSEPATVGEIDESSGRRSHRHRRARESARFVRSSFVAPAIRIDDPGPQLAPNHREVEGRTGRDRVLRHRCLLI